MLRYVGFDVVFQEFPDEVSMAVNISGCPVHCPGCHSKYLWDEVGEELTTEAIDRMMGQCIGVTCVGFMGGDNDTDRLQELLAYMRRDYPNIRLGWYSGRAKLPEGFDLSLVDYVKLGPYVEKLGGLRSEQTNQRLYRVEEKKLCDITDCFWKR
ncbi:MAG: 4Fe-4S cluster-binding domain-containing protein [Bacteroidaceae bacterium]|nr:4Fe-4S cluster-binding domain-containing protein [Bacteroidaceae bacterium]